MSHRRLFLASLLASWAAMIVACGNPAGQSSAPPPTVERVVCESGGANSQTVGEYTIKIPAVLIGPADTYRIGSSRIVGKTDREYFKVILETTFSGQRDKWLYLPWHKTSVTATDSKGKPLAVGADVPDGIRTAAEPESKEYKHGIAAGDFIMLSLPDPEAAFVDLDIPGRHSGTFKFRLMRSVWGGVK